jgi:hypothetical protein
MASKTSALGFRPAEDAALQVIVDAGHDGRHLRECLSTN